MDELREKVTELSYRAVRQEIGPMSLTDEILALFRQHIKELEAELAALRTPEQEQPAPEDDAYDAAPPLCVEHGMLINRLDMICAKLEQRITSVERPTEDEDNNLTTAYLTGYHKAHGAFRDKLLALEKRIEALEKGE